MESLIAVKDVYKIFRSDESEIAILKGISLEIYRGEILVIIGSSGTGKTTLLDVIIGKLKPNAGQIFWKTMVSDITKLNTNELISVRRKFIGFVSQYNELLPQLTVKQNIILGAQLSKIDWKENIEKFNDLVSLLRLSHVVNKLPSTLSEGEKKRVNIASALITEPDILIADEVVEGLDIFLSEQILDLLDEINSKLNTTIVITTHDQMVAQRGDRIIELANGVISGIHDNRVNMKNLVQSRKLITDNEGRIHLPDSILEQVNSSGVFIVSVEDGKIILTPIDETNNNK